MMSSSPESPKPPGFPPPQQPMPPVYFPNPMFYPPPQRERGGFARAIFTTLAVTILGFSITLNIYLLIAQGLFSSDTGETVASQVVTAGNAQSIIAIVQVEGIIMGQAADDLDHVLTYIENASGVKALVLEIDSPGGEVSASDEMYSRLTAFKAQTGIPIIVSMQGVAASGGYYIACAGDQIVAQRATVTGSVGVYWGGLNFSELMKKYGVEDNTIVSTGSNLKLAGAPTRELSQEQRAYMQERVDADLQLFKSVIVLGRGMPAASVDQIATGATFSGEEAKQLKLVDDVGYLNDAIAIAGKKAGINGAQVVRYTRQRSFWDALAGTQGSDANLVETKIGQTSVKIDKQLASELLSPRPMFLYRGS